MNGTTQRTTSRTRAARHAAWVQAQRAGRASGAGLLRWVRKGLRAVVPAGLLLLWLVAVLVRLFVQDRVEGWSAYFYYATPPVVLVVIAGIAGVWCLAARAWRSAIGGGVLVLFSLGWTYRVAWFNSPPALVTAGATRVMFWNVGWGQGGWDAVLDEIRAHQPDVVALVEARDELRERPDNTPALIAAQAAAAAGMEEYWRANLPGYAVEVAGTGLAVLSKREILRRRDGLLGGDYYTAFGYYADVELVLEGGPLHLVVVDVGNMLRKSRAVPLGELNRVLAGLGDEPVLIVGDFNTPADSVYLQPLARRFACAFEVAGRGYAATWPVPVPLLMLDQAWFNEGVRVARCELGWSGASDHRPIVLEVQLAR